MQYTNLQKLVFPSIDINADLGLYFKLNENIIEHIDNNDNDVINFFKGGRVYFDTYFNGFSVNTWKEYTNIKTLFLQIKANGKFLLRIGHHKLAYEHKWLMEKEVELKNELVTIPLDFWKDVSDGIIYLNVIGLDDGELYDTVYCTSDIPVNNVNLGVVVTHFNRKAYVLPAMKRIQTKLINDPLYKDKIKLVVVDNSQNITDEESHGATVIPNLNLGGSGGFTRGLLYLKDNDFTHCLFMDDDASTEIESIRRSFALHQFSSVQDFAISGSLLRENETFRLYEKGAIYDKIITPLNSGLDMKNMHDILLSESNSMKPNYGAWWFFFFRIQDVKKFAFPFFVRGDDIQFSLLNKFNICTTSGIACWGDDFEFKSAPMPIYLDVRSLIVQNMVVGNSSSLPILEIVSRFMKSALLSYNYGTAKAINLALSHILEGPTFFKKNIDMSMIFPLLGVLGKEEKLKKVDNLPKDLCYYGNNDSKLRKLVRYITLNGYLLPSFLLKNKIIYQRKSFSGDPKAIFRYKKVLYYNYTEKAGYSMEHNKKMFFTEVLNFLKLSFSFIMNFNKLKAEYKKDLPELTSENFWREVYNNKGDEK